MEIKTSKNNDILVFEFIGDLNTNTAPLAEEELNDKLQDNDKVIINLEETGFVSSAGLRIFLIAAKKLMASGGKLCLCNANEVVQEVLDISGFSTMLDVKPSFEDAVEGFK